MNFLLIKNYKNYLNLIVSNLNHLSLLTLQLSASDSGKDGKKDSPPGKMTPGFS